MGNDHVENPIRRLLDALPAEVAKQKWSAIYHELVESGMFEHYRQYVSKPGRDLGRTKFRAAVILKRHLEIDDDFFLATSEEQDEYVRRIVKPYYEQTLASNA